MLFLIIRNLALGLPKIKKLLKLQKKKKKKLLSVGKKLISLLFFTTFEMYICIYVCLVIKINFSFSIYTCSIYKCYVCAV